MKPTSFPMYRRIWLFLSDLVLHRAIVYALRFFLHCLEENSEQIPPASKPLRLVIQIYDVFQKDLSQKYRFLITILQDIQAEFARSFTQNPFLWKNTQNFMKNYTKSFLWKINSIIHFPAFFLAPFPNTQSLPRMPQCDGTKWGLWLKAFQRPLKINSI